MKTLIVAICLAMSSVSIQAQDPPALAKKIDALSSEAVTVSTNGKTLWLVPSTAAINEKKLSIPRLCAPLKSMKWKDHPKRDLKFTPEMEHWVWTWNEAAQGDVIEVVLDGEPVLLSELKSIQPAADGTLMLPACFAKTVGQKLRYEPQSHKNTVGYWTTPGDHAEWSISIVEPGWYAVGMLQGLANGQGGSEGTWSLRQGEKVIQEVDFQPAVTGHFQNFRWMPMGIVNITEPGEYQLRIEAKTIKKAALMDIRAVHLGKQAKLD